MDKSFEFRREAALDLLKSTGIRRSNYLPPAIRLLWRIGVQVPPPHFVGFMSTLLVSGAAFATLWGLLMWLFLWRNQDMRLVAAASASGAAGILFGLLMAMYYAYGRRKHHLPSWSSLGSSGGEA